MNPCCHDGILTRWNSIKNKLSIDENEENTAKDVNENTMGGNRYKKNEIDAM